MNVVHRHPAAPVRKPRGQGHLRREEILIAAKDLFLSEGYEATTIRRIAEKVGVSAPALYLYFADKDAIMVDLCDRAFGELLADFSKIKGRGLPPLQTLEAIMRCYLAFGLSHPDEYRLVFMTPTKNLEKYNHLTPPTDDPDVKGGKGALAFREIQNIVAGLVADGTFVDGDPVTLSEALWAAGHGLVALLITKSEFPWSDRDRMIEAAIRLPLYGLLRRP